MSNTHCFNRVHLQVIGQRCKYQFVKDKFATHGVEKTEDGVLILNDQKLFSLFVEFERAVRKGSFDAVQSAALGNEDYLISIEKRQLMAFAYMYQSFLILRQN